jgi:hypothetical protein
MAVRIFFLRRVSGIFGDRECQESLKKEYAGGVRRSRLSKASCTVRAGKCVRASPLALEREILANDGLGKGPQFLGIDLWTRLSAGVPEKTKDLRDLSYAERRARWQLCSRRGKSQACLEPD